MKQLQFEQFLPITIDEAWAFFSNPANLNLITPDKLQFKTLTDLPELMTEGLIIRYKINPMLSIPLNWTTRINSMKKNVMFVDEQIKGPYKTWLHEHHFQEVENGVMMTDKLTYDIGYSFLGDFIGWLWVDKQVREIFRYRQIKLNEIFAAGRQEKGYRP